MKTIIALATLWLATAASQAQLSVTVLPAKITSQKAVVPLAFKNNLNEKIESARAAVFLLDEQGKMVGQSTKWVIGGSEDKTGLATGATNAFHFVVTTDKPLTTTNLTAKVTFSRLVLQGGKLADATKDVQIQNTSN